MNVCSYHFQSRNSAGKCAFEADLCLEYTELWYAWAVSMKSYTSGQLHEIRECVRGPVNTVSVSVYRLLKCLGIVNCRIRPTKRGTKGVEKRRIPIVITVLRPPKPPGQYGSNGNNLKVQLPTDTLPTHVTCILLNTQSLCNKALTVREHMLDYDADIMLLTETWLKPSKSAIVSELTTPGYNFIGECRTVKRGGGTGLLFKSGYKFAKMPSTRFKTFEVLDVKTTHCARPLRVIIIYRSPTSATRSFLDELALYISDLAVVREDILMAGDFNLHFHLPNASGVQYLKQILADNNMHQHVTQPTHRSGNMLDLVITRASSNIVTTTDVCNSSISDHYSVIFPLHVTKPRSSSQMRQVRNFKRMDHASFEAHLISELANVDTELGVEIVLCQYEKAMKTSIDKHAPIRRRTTQSRKREPWYNDDIHNARQLRRINETRWRESRLEIDRQIFVQHRSEVNTMISRAKQQYYEHKLAATDQKTCSL